MALSISSKPFFGQSSVGSGCGYDCGGERGRGRSRDRGAQRDRGKGGGGYRGSL